MATGLYNCSGFSGGYVILDDAAPNGFSQYALATGYVYTSGNNLVWDTVVTSDPSVTYNTSTGVFTANYAGVYQCQMAVGTTNWASGQSLLAYIANPGIQPVFAFNGAVSIAGVFTVPLIFDLFVTTAGSTFFFGLTLTSPTTVTLANGTPSVCTIQYLPSQ